MKTYLLKVEEQQFIIDFEGVFEAKWNGYSILNWATRVLIQ